MKVQSRCKNGNGDRQKKERGITAAIKSIFFYFSFQFFPLWPTNWPVKILCPSYSGRNEGENFSPQPWLSGWENSRKSARCLEVWLETNYKGLWARKKSLEYVEEKSCVCSVVVVQRKRY